MLESIWVGKKNKAEKKKKMKLTLKLKERVTEEIEQNQLNIISRKLSYPIIISHHANHIVGEKKRQTLLFQPT